MRRETLHYEKELHNLNPDVLEMAAILLNGGWLLLWIIAICSLIWEDDRMTIPGIMGSTVLWITRLWSKVWLLVSKGLCALKSFIWGAILQETKGRVFFSFFFLATVWFEPSDLLWHVSALVFNPCAFPGVWPDQECCSGPGCVSCLSAYSN